MSLKYLYINPGVLQLILTKNWNNRGPRDFIQTHAKIVPFLLFSEELEFLPEYE